jgi:hypothetical protein
MTLIRVARQCLMRESRDSLLGALTVNWPRSAQTLAFTCNLSVTDYARHEEYQVTLSTGNGRPCAPAYHGEYLSRIVFDVDMRES